MGKGGIKFYLTYSIPTGGKDKQQTAATNSMDPDQDQCFVGPVLGPTCLQWLSADDKSQLSRKLSSCLGNVI